MTRSRRQVFCLGLASVFCAAAGLGVTGIALAASNNPAPSSGSVSVMSMWTSGSEAKSMRVLAHMMDKQGFHFLNDAVAGAGGDNEYTVLKTRILSGNPPTAAIMKAPQIAQWCKKGLMMSVDEVAKKEHWSKLLPSNVAKGLQCHDQYVAVPFDLHRLNWLWINKAVLKKAGVSIPHSWDSFVSALKKLKAAGVVPLAGGGNTWQSSVEFGALAMATGGPAFYRKAFVDLDPSALSGKTMVKTFKRLRTIGKYESPKNSGLTWNHDSLEVAKGKAAMQIMGDWAKGEFTLDGAPPGQAIACIPFLGKQAGFVYTVDAAGIFRNPKSSKNAVYGLAGTIISPAFQRTFNMAKGAIPARQDVSLKGFDPCAKKSRHDLLAAEKNHAVLPSIAVDQAQLPSMVGAITDVIAKFETDKSMSPEDAARRLAQSVKQAKLISSL